MNRRFAVLAVLAALCASSVRAAGLEAAAYSADYDFAALGARVAATVSAGAPSVAVPAATRSDHGSFLYSPADRRVLFCAASGCRPAAEGVLRALPDGRRGLFALRDWGLYHCSGGACVPLSVSVNFTESFVRADGFLYGTSAAGTYVCRPNGCTKLTSAFFDSHWNGGFDAAGFWASGPQGTWRCNASSCKKISDEHLDVLFSVGVPSVKDVAWGGNAAGTWRCTQTACVNEGGLSWYNTYAFDATGNLFASSGFPNSTYACSAAGCRKLDDEYRYWHGPDAYGGMVASLQIPEQTQRCQLTGCVKVASGLPAGYTVIGPVGGGESPEPFTRSRGLPGYAFSLQGTDGALYGIRAKTLPRLDRRAVAAAPAEVVRDGQPLGGAPASCWSWEFDEDTASQWQNSCELF